jgi:hypothetical protein
MTYSRSTIFLLLAFSCQIALAQDSTRFTQRLRLQDGVYLSLQSFQGNRPDWRWNELRVTMVVNEETAAARVRSLHHLGEDRVLKPSDIWGFTYDGIPYLRLDRNAGADSAVIFSGLLVRGRICLYVFEEEVTRMVKITAYNPATGRPFRTGEVPRKEWLEIWEMLDFHSGVTQPFTRENFLKWARGDEALVRQIEAMNADDIDLFRAVETYNERNPVYFK